MPDLTPAQIAANALKPASASHEGTSAAQVPIPDQIDAAKFAAANAAVQSPYPFTTFRMVPPGTT